MAAFRTFAELVISAVGAFHVVMMGQSVNTILSFTHYGFSSTFIAVDRHHGRMVVEHLTDGMSNTWSLDDVIADKAFRRSLNLTTNPPAMPLRTGQNPPLTASSVLNHPAVRSVEVPLGLTITPDSHPGILTTADSKDRTPRAVDFFCGYAVLSISHSKFVAGLYIEAYIPDAASLSSNSIMIANQCAHERFNSASYLGLKDKVQLNVKTTFAALSIAVLFLSSTVTWAPAAPSPLELSLKTQQVVSGHQGSVEEIPSHGAAMIKSQNGNKSGGAIKEQNSDTPRVINEQNMHESKMSNGSRDCPNPPIPWQQYPLQMFPMTRAYPGAPQLYTDGSAYSHVPAGASFPDDSKDSDHPRAGSA